MSENETQKVGSQLKETNPSITEGKSDVVDPKPTWDHTLNSAVADTEKINVMVTFDPIPL